MAAEDGQYGRAAAAMRTATSPLLFSGGGRPVPCPSTGIGGRLLIGRRRRRRMVKGWQRRHLQAFWIGMRRRRLLVTLLLLLPPDQSS